MSSEVSKLVRALQKQKFRCELTKNGHYKVYPPNGGPFIVMSSTPNDKRATLNARSWLRRAGFKE